jgi:hypothetical protein
MKPIHEYDTDAPTSSKHTYFIGADLYGSRVYLTAEELWSDIPSHAKIYDDISMARKQCAYERQSLANQDQLREAIFFATTNIDKNFNQI